MKQSLVPNLETPEVSIRVAGDLSLEGLQNIEVMASCGNDDADLIRQEGDQVRIECNDDCKISLPVGSIVQVESVGGDAAIKNLDGRLTILRIGGDLDLENVAQVVLDNVGGDAALTIIRGVIQVGKVGGDLIGKGLTDRMQIDSVGGDLSLTDCRSVQAGAGGDISVKMGGAGPVGSALHSGGDLRLIVPEDLSANFTVESGGRDISIHLQHLLNRVETRRYQFSVGSGEMQDYILEAGGDVSILGIALQETRPDQQPEEPEDEVNRLGEEITSHVDTKLREVDFSSRIRAEISQKTQQMTERAMRQAEERIQAVLRRMEGKSGPKVGEGLPIITPVPAQTEIPAAAGKVQEPVTDDERLMILQMVENKKITVDEAEALLEALESQAPDDAV